MFALFAAETTDGVGIKNFHIEWAANLGLRCADTLLHGLMSSSARLAL